MPKMMPNQILVGSFIQQKRSELNYTQEHLAKLIGVSKAAVSNWENGVSMVDVKYLIPLSHVFAVNADELLFPKFQPEKNEFYYYADLFKRMLSDELEEKSLCDKIIELYIQSKIETANLIKEYFSSENEEILDAIQRINKFGLAFYFVWSSIEKDLMNDVLQHIKEEKIDLKEIHPEDLIDTCWSDYEYNKDGTIKRNENSIFCDLFNMFYEETCEEISIAAENAYYHFVIYRAILLEKMIDNCSSSIVVKYIRTFSQEYKNFMLKNLFNKSKHKINNKIKKILRILLKAGCKFINDNGEDLTHLIYEKCI